MSVFRLICAIKPDRLLRNESRSPLRADLTFTINNNRSIIAVTRDLTTYEWATTFNMPEIPAQFIKHVVNNYLIARINNGGGN